MFVQDCTKRYTAHQVLYNIALIRNYYIGSISSTLVQSYWSSGYGRQVKQNAINW